MVGEKEMVIRAVKPYTNAWLKEIAPKKFAMGWRISPKVGLIPPKTIKPTIKKPTKCMNCGEKTNFTFTATGLDNPEYWWECNKCGVLHKAR